MSDFILPFDLRLCNEMDQHALLCCQKYNFGNESDWFGTFRGGLQGFYSRIHGVRKHFYQVHAWIPSPRTPAADTEYHLSAILFNMDSAIECFTFALNALGNSVYVEGFRDVTDSKALKQICPTDVLGDPDRKTPPMSGYTKYFPRTQKLWIRNRDILNIIFENHDVSKHRETIYSGGAYRNDPPTGFFEALGVTDKSAESIMFTSMAEIILTPDPKTPRVNRQPTLLEDQILLEEIAIRFCYFINKTVALALKDALANIEPPIKEFKEKSNETSDQCVDIDPTKPSNEDA